MHKNSVWGNAQNSDVGNGSSGRHGIEEKMRKKKYFKNAQNNYVGNFLDPLAEAQEAIKYRKIKYCWRRRRRRRRRRTRRLFFFLLLQVDADPVHHQAFQVGQDAERSSGGGGRTPVIGR